MCANANNNEQPEPSSEEWVEQEAAEFDFIHQANALKWVPELVEIEVPDE